MKKINSKKNTQQSKKSQKITDGGSLQDFFVLVDLNFVKESHVVVMALYLKVTIG